MATVYFALARGFQSIVAVFVTGGGGTVNRLLEDGTNRMQEDSTQRILQ